MAMSEDSSTQDLEMLEHLAYQEQGYHEMEYCSGNESDLHERKRQCKKNPGHVSFIPVQEFQIQHLPQAFRHQLVLDYVKAVSDLTVRVVVDYTSTGRPDGYPCQILRGKKGMKRYGSGMVLHVFRSFFDMDGKTCPCQQCKNSLKDAKLQWGVFFIYTALHVIYNAEESLHTNIDLFYDSADEIDFCPKLESTGMWYSDSDTDHCVISCVTHNAAVAHTLEELYSHYQKQRTKLQDKFKGGDIDKTFDKMACLVISHPHGNSKHITVGEWSGKQETYPGKWTYTADTCQGSSGAPVFLLGGRWELRHLTASHSGCTEKGENQSGFGWL